MTKLRRLIETASFPGYRDGDGGSGDSGAASGGMSATESDFSSSMDSDFGGQDMGTGFGDYGSSMEDSGGEWTTESFEGGTVSYDMNGNYSVTNNDGSTYGYDVDSGVSYNSTGNGYGVTATNSAGQTVTYDSVHDLQAELESEKLSNAKKAGATIGQVLGPVGTVVGYFIGDTAYKAINPDKVAETISRESFHEGVGDSTGTTSFDLGALGTYSVPTISLSAPEYNTWANEGGSLNISASGNSEAGTPTNFTANVVEQDLADKYAGQDLTAEQVSLEWLDYMKEQQTAWDEVYDPIQQNLSEYYQNLTPDSYEARSVQAIQKSYQEQSDQVTKFLTQQGLGDSGLQAQQQTLLAASAAGDKAEVRATAEDVIAKEKLGFLQTGINQQGAISSGISNAYASTAATLGSAENTAANIKAQEDAMEAQAEAADKSAMWGALGTGVGMIFG